MTGSRQPGGYQVTGKERRYLAGDIGGTKTVLALFSPETGIYQPYETRIFQSNRYPSLEAIIREYLDDKNYRIQGASIGIAGPVLGGRSRVTNLDWLVDENKISQELGGAQVKLLNDLQAIAYGIPHLSSQDIEIINPGEPESQGAIAVIAPGTGLGEGFLVRVNKRYQPCPSEGGHASFSPCSPLETELLHYLWHQYTHVSFERVCSGIGMINLYQFMRDGKGLEEPQWLRERLSSVKDPVPVIVQAALDGSAHICEETLKLFVSILGSEAGNLALKVLATGGVYLAGGIPPRILPFLRRLDFLRAFTDKGRFAELLARVRVCVVVHAQMGLFGAACHGLLHAEEA